MGQKATNLEELLDQISNADTEDGEISFSAILEAVGRRSFGPLLLVAGLITLAPIIGDIPGMPTVMGVFVLLTAGQLLLHREHFWLPQWLLKRSVAKDKLHKAFEWLYPPARFVDRWLRPRLTMFVQGIGLHVVAVVCIIIAAAMPAMELVPFSANGAGAALTAFGVSLIAHDGFLALLAFVITVSTFGLVIYNLI